MFSQIKTYFFRILPLVFFIFSGFFSFSQKQLSGQPKALKGLIDLRQTSLTSEMVSLEGEWGIYWKELRAPWDPEKEPDAYIPFPKLWTNTLINGKPLPSMGYATYSLTVLLPKHQNKLA